MKKLVVLLSLAALSLGVFAQDAKPKEKTTVKCPVMADNDVNIAKATKEGMFADYEGRRYFFCCAGCKPAFQKNPAKYAKADSIPQPTIKCAVMADHEVKIEKATKEGLFADNNGRRYFFCCEGCKPAFNKEPGKFAKAPSIPTPKKS